MVLEFEASGLRQNEFCRNHGLALSTLQRQLRKRRVDQINPGVLRPETLERKGTALQEVIKEVVGIRVHLTHSLFGHGMLRRLILRVFLAKATSAPLRF